MTPPPAWPTRPTPPTPPTIDDGDDGDDGPSPVLPGDVGAAIRALYGAFNAKDIDAVLAYLHPDVDCPNMVEGGRLHGRDAVRAYWLGLFAAIDPQLEVDSITLGPDGVVDVVIYQVVRQDDGIFKEARPAEHRLTWRDGKVVRLDITLP